MDTILLDTIPYIPDLPDLMMKLRIRQGSPNAAELQSMAREAQAVARPKAAYKIAFVEVSEEDRVVIDGVTFTSRVLRTNLEGLHRVYPHLATCGLELDAWAHSFTDMLSRFWADAIAESALREAINYCKTSLTEIYLPSSSDQIDEGIPQSSEPVQLADMNPGSLEDWPINEQKQLFALLGSGSESIGVELSDTFLMHPIKSVSGIYFANAEGYANCQLCPREVCSNRKAPYDAHLFEQKYARVNSR